MADEEENDRTYSYISDKIRRLYAGIILFLTELKFEDKILSTNYLGALKSILDHVF